MNAMRKYQVVSSQILSFIQCVQVSQFVCFTSMTWINFTVWASGHSRPGKRTTKCKLHFLLTYKISMRNICGYMWLKILLYPNFSNSREIFRVYLLALNSVDFRDLISAHIKGIMWASHVTMGPKLKCIQIENPLHLSCDKLSYDIFF